MTAALELGEWSAARLGCTLPPGKTRYPFYRRLGGPQVWTGGKSRPYRDSIPDPPARSKSLYRLNYAAHIINIYYGNVMIYLLLHYLLLIRQTFDWLAAFHMDFLQTILLTVVKLSASLFPATCCKYCSWGLPTAFFPQILLLQRCLRQNLYAQL